MKRFVLAAMFSLLLTGLSATAYAGGGGGAGPGTVGCDPAVVAAAKAKAEALVAADRAIIDQTIDQPASVLMSTCYNEASGNSADVGGFFSGNFSGDLAPIIGTALNVFYDDFDSSIAGFFSSAISSFFGGGGTNPGSTMGSLFGAIGGALGGLFGGGASSLGSTYDCEGIEELWMAVVSEGVQPGIVYPLISEILSGTAPSGAGSKFQKSWTASSGKSVFTNAQTAISAITPPSVPSFAGVTTFCSALTIAGVAASCP